MIFQIKTKVWEPWYGYMLINEYKCSHCLAVMPKRPSNNKCRSCKR